MDKYGEGRSEQEKVSNFLENICMMNKKLESEITFYGSNKNGN